MILLLQKEKMKEKSVYRRVTDKQYFFGLFNIKRVFVAKIQFLYT